MTSKQRASLRSLASKENTIFQIGKNDLTDELIEGLRVALKKRELIKISVLKASSISETEVAEKLSKVLCAEVVAVVGSKIVLYKKSSDKNAKHIEF